MIRNCLLAAMVAAALGAVSLAPAQIERDHGAHVHGVGTGNFSQDGSELRLELEIPGVNLIGFEHPPRSDEQQRLLDDALAFLGAGQWLVADPRGDCDVDRINAHTHGFDEEHGHDNDHYHDDEHGHDGDHHHHHDTDAKDREHHGHHGDDHDHAHDHDHGNDDHDHDHAHGHDHAEFHVIAHLNCETPASLRWVELRLFDAYPGNERMDIDVLTDQVATRARLTPANQRIDLSRQ